MGRVQGPPRSWNLVTNSWIAKSDINEDAADVAGVMKVRASSPSGTGLQESLKPVQVNDKTLGFTKKLTPTPIDMNGKDLEGEGVRTQKLSEKIVYRPDVFELKKPGGGQSDLRIRISA